MNQAGIVLVAVAGLWLAYLVPHRSRYRQQLLESRADDRFSEHLRVLRVAHAAGSGSAGMSVGSASSRTSGRTTSRTTSTTSGAHRATGVRLHPARRGGGGHMDRPHGTTDRVVADAARRTAAEHAQRVAHLARRRAAARRRALLTAVLLVAVVAGWGVVAATSATVLVGAVPTAGLLGVLALGRAAVRAGARADARWADGASSRLPLPAATAGARTVGRAVRPSDARTEVMARVPGRRSAPADRDEVTVRPAETSRSETALNGAMQAGATQAGAASSGTAAVPQQARRVAVDEAVPTQRTDASARSTVAGAAEATGADRATAPAPQRTSAWSPVPVPPPSYTLKPSAPRREPAPLPADEELATAPRAATEEATEAATPPARPAADGTASLDLDAILARRRASGE